jgi:hypothetical protein
VFSASAFHWIDPEVSWEKAAHMLVPGTSTAFVLVAGGLSLFLPSTSIEAAHSATV